MNAVTEGGRVVVATYQIADVTRPLCVVSKMCERGNTVVSEKDGGNILSSDGTKTTFRREANVYMLDMYMMAPACSDIRCRVGEGS